jgi:hypothetical protein
MEIMVQTILPFFLPQKRFNFGGGGRGLSLFAISFQFVDITMRLFFIIILLRSRVHFPSSRECSSSGKGIFLSAPELSSKVREIASGFRAKIASGFRAKIASGFRAKIASGFRAAASRPSLGSEVSTLPVQIGGYSFLFVFFLKRLPHPHFGNE